MQEECHEKPKRCGKHTFKLVGNRKTYYKGTTIVDFKTEQKTKKIQKKTAIPTFNNDKKFFTPTFIIPLLFLPQDEKFHQEYQNKLKENVEQKSSLMLIPKPRNKNKYCGVCRRHYEDYLEHINEADHVNKSQNSVWQKELVTEALKFWSLSQIQCSQTLSNKKIAKSSCQINSMETTEQISSSSLILQ